MGGLSPEPRHDLRARIHSRHARTDSGSFRGAFLRQPRLLGGDPRLSVPRGPDGVLSRHYGAKAHEEKLRESELRERNRALYLQTIIDAVPGALFLTRDRECRMIQGNRGVYELLRMPPGSNVSKSASEEDRPTSWTEMKDGVAIPPEQLPIQRASRGEEVRNFEMDLVFDDGVVKTIFGNASALVGEDGEAAGVVAAFVDITERKVMEEELRSARQVADTANRAKSSFLAHMSHELRTPMNAVLGMIDLALSDELLPHVREYLETAHGSADTLLALLNDILDFSRIEAGRLELENAPFRLRPALEQTVKALSIRAYEKGLHIATHIADDVPDCLVGDALRLKQILANLLSNAIKFTDQGRVAVRVSLDARTENEVRLHCAVEDTGIGIQPEILSRIFTPFAQADASTTRQYGGSGLGLAIAANLVEMMGGRLEVQSQPGRGSVFHFVASFGRTADAPPVPASGPGSADFPSPPRALRILVAEDTPANQKLITMILGKRGHSVEVAASGHQVLDLFATREFDLILMDVQMPLMDGLAATTAIRRLPAPKNRIPIIAMTAYAMKGDRERCLRAGMNAYLAKPIHLRELVELVERLGEDRICAAPRKFFSGCGT